MRFGQFHQLLNFALHGYAIHTAAYVTALWAQLHAVASAVGIMAAAVSAAVAGAGRLIKRRADLAEAPLRALQDRLAEESQISSLRMFTEASTVPRFRSRHLAAAVFGLASLAWLTAAVYPMTI
jgi:hypothetical protein